MIPEGEFDTVTLAVTLPVAIHNALQRYAAARGLTPEEAIVDLLQGGMRGAAELHTRLEEARRIAMQEARKAHDAYVASLG